MDPFLRRVMEQRELEQEAAIIATPVETFLRDCRVCGRRISGGAEKECRVCLQCGGPRMHRKLLEQDAQEAARAHRVTQMLQLAGFRPLTQEHLMSDRKCTNCEKPLRSNNQHDTCHACRTTGATKGEPEADGGGQTTPRAPSRKAKTDAQKRFKVVASALGVDPDNLIAEFCEGWLERIRSSANFGTDA